MSIAGPTSGRAVGGSVPASPGRVVLVGAGPGSVDLLTLKAARLIAAADWLVHDALVQPEVVALASRARIICVGKRAGRKSTRQHEINLTLIDCARRGGLVVRLKGGDPLLFARAQEELDALREAGIAVEVVPGITTAQAAYAALAAPMTERGRRRSMVFATPQVGAAAGATGTTGAIDGGQAASGEARLARDGRLDVQWARALVNAEGGALYMASTVAGRTRATLLSLGMPADTPAIWIINVSLPNQSVISTTLGELRSLPEELAGQPALLLLGTAVPSPWHEPEPSREPATATLSP
jgi:uroporphyrin-III C-methyltransferase